MKKILFLMLIMGVFSPLINAYEYVIFSRGTGSGSQDKFVLFLDLNNKLVQRSIKFNDAYYDVPNINLGYLSAIKHSSGYGFGTIGGYITASQFYDYYSNDLNFLNALYTSNNHNLMGFLNYLYNELSFSTNNYINYDNYELLYNEDGLAVESIVNGVWAGLYLDSQKSKSGALYNKNGSMVYYNGKEVTPVTSFLVWLQKFTNKVVIETFEEIQRSLVAGIIAAVVLVLAIVRLVLELLPSSITPRRRRYYGGGRGSLSDYGDGSQVAASVRARLAAKNRALKARAYDRSGVEQSLQNSILFDLENDR